MSIIFCEKNHDVIYYSQVRIFNGIGRNNFCVTGYMLGNFRTWILQTQQLILVRNWQPKRDQLESRRGREKRYFLLNNCKIVGMYTKKCRNSMYGIVIAAFYGEEIANNRFV